MQLVRDLVLPRRNTTSEIAVGRSGRVVYGSNRGHDSIAVFAVDETSGVLTPVGWEPSQGKTPRFFALDPAGLFLYAANQGSDTMPRLGRRGPSPATACGADHLASPRGKRVVWADVTRGPEPG